MKRGPKPIPIPLKDRRKVYIERYKEKHLDAWMASVDKSERKRAAKRMAASAETRRGILNYSPRTSVEEEVRRHLARGRDIASICVWMNRPASIIAPMVEKIKAETL